MIGEFSAGGQCVVDDAHHMLIIHPDHLISATVIADSFGCIRRAVLQDRVKATNDASPPQVYGHILHEIFQEALKANKWDTGWLQSVTEAAAKRHLEDIYQINIPFPKAIEHLNGKIRGLQAWADLFVNQEPKVSGLTSSLTMASLTSPSLALLSATEVARPLLCVLINYSMSRSMFGRQCTV